MTEEVSLSYSFDTTPPPAPKSDTGPLVAFTDCELIGINDAMMLAINRGNGRQALVAPQVVDALKTCHTFEPIEEHAQRLAKTRPELRGNVEMPRQALRNLDQSGMLLRAEAICERLNRPAERRVAPTRVFVITCDRPAAVERLLQSLLRVETLTQHQALFLIDDSRDPANRAANAEAVARFNTISARDMTYFGADAQAEMLHRLVRAHPEHENGIRFLIDPARWAGKPTFGRARTLCLLLSVGYRAIVMDDDVLCQAVLSPVQESGVGLGSGNDRQAAFFPDLDTLMGGGVPADFDPLSGHAQVLGRSLHEALRTFTGGPVTAEQLRGVNAAMSNVLREDSPVLVTQCGSWGDPGTGGAHWVLLLDDVSLDRLLAAPQGLSAAIEQRLSWLGSTRPSIFKMGFMSQMTGLDNSELLPPYFPAFRGEDLLFAATVEAMHHRACVVEYPWSVPHLPLEQRRDRGLRAPIAAKGEVAMFARYLTENIDYEDASNPGRRLRHIADDARRLADRADTDLVLDYRRELAKIHAHQLVATQGQKARSRDINAATWQKYLDRAIEELQNAIVAEHGPGELLGSGSNEEALRGFRAMATDWADALDAWSAMRTACADGAAARADAARRRSAR